VVSKSPRYGITSLLSGEGVGNLACRCPVGHLLGSLQAHGGTPTPNENVGCDYCLRKNLRKLALLLTPEGLCGASFHNSDGILYVERERKREGGREGGREEEREQ
jgi:hypothetical protein